MSRCSNADAHFQNNLYAFWINVPPGECASAGIGALEQMLRVGALFVVPADRFDTSSYSKSAPPEIADNRPKYSEKLGAQGPSRIVVRDHPHRTQKLVSLLEAQPIFEHHRLFLENGLLESSDDGGEFAAAFQVPDQRWAEFVPVIQNPISEQH